VLVLLAVVGILAAVHYPGDPDGCASRCDQQGPTIAGRHGLPQPAGDPCANDLACGACAVLSADSPLPLGVLPSAGSLLVAVAAGQLVPPVGRELHAVLLPSGLDHPPRRPV
jgi:hypothetical protein